MAKPASSNLPAVDAARWHLRFGWWSLLVFAGLGLTLEILHGFKVGAYLDASNETRRLMWRLAHAHGALLGVIHIAYGLTLQSMAAMTFSQTTSRSLTGASALLPAGFFLGGVQFYAGDPGLGVALVPVGAGLLLIALFRVARSL